MLRAGERRDPSVAAFAALRLAIVAEAEEPRQRFAVGADGIGVAERLELLGRREQELFHDQAGDFVDSRARFVRLREAGELVVEPFELGAPDVLAVLPQRDDGRHRAARSQPGAELVEFLGDDRFGARDFAGAARQVFPHRRLQVVDVVEEDLLDFAGGRLDVARQRDVDDEQRAVAPRPHDRFDARLGQDRRGRAGRGDDDVAAGERGVHLVPRRGGRAADRLGGSGRVGHGAADDDDLVHALRLHVPRGQLAHLAGADHDDGAAAQIAEDLAGERRRRESDRDRARAEAGLGAHALADRKRRMEEPIEDRADDLHVVGDGVRLFHLTENLRLADDQRIEAGGDPEEMSRGVEVGDVVDVRRDRRTIDAVELADEAHQIRARRRHIVAGDVQLGAIAGRQHDRLARRAARGERRQRAGEPVHVKIDPLAQLDRRGLVTDSHQCIYRGSRM